jgi:SPASM domain peptide maturase of grasp-with-spasm system
MTTLNEDGIYILYGNIYPVKGYFISALYDLQFNKIELIPNDICKILENGFKLKEYDNYDITLSIDELKEYLEYLLSINLIFHTYQPELFPRISTVFTSPATITNAVIEIDHQSITIVKLDMVISQLRKMGCTVLLIKILNEISSDEQIKLNNIILQNEIEDLTIIMPDSKINNAIVNNLPNIYPIRIIIHEAKAFSIQEEKHRKIIFTDKSLRNNHCSVITNPKLFTINMDFFIESYNYNICLHRKMCIDIFGNIKNCLMLDKIFGNIMKDTLINIAKNNKFQYLWHIKKDDIDVCKYC